jgi:Na+/H+ antiporter NhaC
MTITQTIENSGIEDGLLTFIRSIPYNFYAIFVLLFAFYIAITRKDFLRMKACEHGAGALNAGRGSGIRQEGVSAQGTIADLLAPNCAVVVLSLLSILWLGGFFEPEEKTLIQTFTGADTTLALNFGTFGALVLCFLLYIPRKLMTVQIFFESAVEGMKSMLIAVLILILAWTLSGIVTDSLGAAVYIEEIMGRIQQSANISFLPVMVFLISALSAFGLGSWGTFLVTIPLVAVIANAVRPELFYLYLAATLGGSVFGDHASPITDTTILTSICSGCDHIGHVKSQLPYALLICAASAASFACIGFTGSGTVGYVTGVAFVAVALFFIYKIKD